MAEKPVAQSLKQNVSLLGAMLGEALVESDGTRRLEQVETIRQLAKKAREGQDPDHAGLADYLGSLADEDLVPVARAFSHFLNLVNIADQHHLVSREMDAQLSATQTLQNTFVELSKRGCSRQKLTSSLEKLEIDLVLTAHPTEIARRSLINKHLEISQVLSQLELQGHTDRERDGLYSRLRELIVQMWHTDDFREHRPTPVDEARWGLAVIENSLWDAVPNFARRLRSTCWNHLEYEIGPGCSPVRFSFWMGGDRDGNPNVTARVTREVLYLCRWKAIDLYLQDIQVLIDELSMGRCTKSLSEMANGEREPYRKVLRDTRSILRQSRDHITAMLRSGQADQDVVPVFGSSDQIWRPLKACYDSLVKVGLERVANGKLRDTLDRISSFGVHLVRLDVRQESTRHTEAMAELTRYLGLGDYAGWDEQRKREFLLQELQSKRPLIPDHWYPSAEVQEVLDTCREIARHPRQAFGGYVISMAREASDVLCVKLLLKACGVPYELPVAPLFETLDDLNNAESVISDLFSMDWYRGQIEGFQMVMIGYSDSAKDAGMFAAGWAQYQAQEKLLKVAERAGVALTLFHGRGGTIGRGGAPARDALISQPPGSLKNGLRVTEQGEMIRAKLGMSSIATKTLAIYASAIIEANTDKPPVPVAEWRQLMDRVSDSSCKAYRAMVREEPDFVRYFRQATPEQELASLPLGSRPARRRSGGGIETLRAIPWIFAWSQTRLMLPAWLGAGEALAEAMESGDGPLIEQMIEDWPFFATRLSMLEMVFTKADLEIALFYDERLVDKELRFLGEKLRESLRADRETIRKIAPHPSSELGHAYTQASVDFRNTYVDPLNLLQAELLKRNRATESPLLQQAIMVTIAGIAAGLRNTG